MDRINAFCMTPFTWFASRTDGRSQTWREHFRYRHGLLVGMFTGVMVMGILAVAMGRIPPITAAADTT